MMQQDKKLLKQEVDRNKKHSTSTLCLHSWVKSNINIPSSTEILYCFWLSYSIIKSNEEKYYHKIIYIYTHWSLYSIHSTHTNTFLLLFLSFCCAYEFFCCCYFCCIHRRAYDMVGGLQLQNKSKMQSEKRKQWLCWESLFHFSFFIWWKW